MTTDEQIEAVARECANNVATSNHGEVWQEHVQALILTAANRIAAIKVRESVDLLAAAEETAEWSIVDDAKTKLRAIVDAGE